jgi:hypothetical protein
MPLLVGADGLGACVAARVRVAVGVTAFVGVAVAEAMGAAAEERTDVGEGDPTELPPLHADTSSTRASRGRRRRVTAPGWHAGTFWTCA